MPGEPKLNVAESRQCISSVSFLTISGCPSEVTWSFLRLQLEKMQRQWPRNKECYICNLAPTFFLTHFMKPTPGVVWSKSDTRENFVRKLQE